MKSLKIKVQTVGCGPEGTRTPYLVVANDALYQMSYRPPWARMNDE